MAAFVKTRSDVTFILLFFVALAIVGIVAGGFFVRDYARARASAAWPTVEGVVLSQLSDDSASMRYAYSFRGQTYESERERVFSASLAPGERRRYLPGERVSVFVNPVDPSYAVLRPGGAAATFVVFCLFSGICIFVGLGGIVWTFSDGVAEADGEAQAA